MVIFCESTHDTGKYLFTKIDGASNEPYPQMHHEIKMAQSRGTLCQWKDLH